MSDKKQAQVAGEIHNDRAVQAFKRAFHAENENGGSYDVAVQAGLDAANAASPAPASAQQEQGDAVREALTADDVEWVVNDNAELGVKIGNQFFFLYKGDSLVYESGKHDDGTPMRWRPVGKREFGECCYPVKFYKEGARLPSRYTDELVYTPGLSFGQPGDCDWRDLPALRATNTGKEQ